MSIPIKIDSFTGEWDFLSNFFTYPIAYRNMLFKSTEHAYQADKFLDEEQRRVFTLDFNPNLTAGQAKRLGLKMKPIREDWEAVKLATMRDVLIEKFTPMEMRLKLASTVKAELVEGNWWHDTYWGVCDGSGRHKKCPGHDPYGENHLGILLMEVRTLLMPDGVYSEFNS
jgi:ribA/ribD-fused uncharacterized protein